MVTLKTTNRVADPCCGCALPSGNGANGTDDCVEMLWFNDGTDGFVGSGFEANGTIVVVSDGNGAKRTPVIGSTLEKSVFGAAGFIGVTGLSIDGTGCCVTTAGDTAFGANYKIELVSK